MAAKNKIKATLFLWWHKFVYQLKRIQLFLFKVLDAVAVTFSLLILGSLLFFFTDIQACFFKTYSPESVLVNVAATIGTIVAIVFGLAVIPVQRAAEAFSPSVLRIYARDWRGRVVFAFMGIACVLVFSFSVKGVAGAPSYIAFIVGIFLLAICIDLVRWFHKTTVDLLDPLRAIQVAEKEARKAVNRADRFALKAARAGAYDIEPDQKEKVDYLDIKGLLQNQERFSRPVNYWIGEFSEIARKAVVRSEKRVAGLALSAITNCVCIYLEKRKDDLCTYADATVFLATTNNAISVLQPTVEELLVVAKSAINNGDEDTALLVLKAYADIGIFSANIRGMKLVHGSGPLASAPIYYIDTVLKEAMRHQLSEVLFQGSALIRRIAVNFPKDTRAENLEKLIEELQSIAVYFYLRNEPGLAEEVTKHMADVVMARWQSEAASADFIFRNVIESLCALAPLALKAHAAAGDYVTNPLEGAYSLTHENALPYVLVRLLESAQVNKEHPHRNPYYEFISVLDHYYSSTRSMIEKVEIDSSMLLWEIVQALELIIEVIAQRCTSPLSPDFDYEDEIKAKVSWLLSILWVAFNNKKTVPPMKASQCCDLTAMAGIRFLALGDIAIADNAFANIRTMAKALIDSSPDANAYHVADCLIYVEILAQAADQLGYDPFAKKIRDSQFEKLTDSGERWAEILTAIERRKDQLRERQERWGYSPDGGFQKAERALVMIRNQGD